MRGTRVGWALGATTLLGGAAAACGLDMRGLLALSAADGGSPGEEAGGDSTTMSGEGGSQADGGGGHGHDGAVGQDAKATGEASVDAPPPPPDAQIPAPLVWDGGAISDPDFLDTDWVKFCVGLTGCFDVGSISQCMAMMQQPSVPEPYVPTLDMIACVVNQGNDCTGVASCFGSTPKCSQPPPADSCSGNSWVTCRFGFALSVDCGPMGMVCSPGNGNAGCGFGDCYAWQEGQRTCAGQYLVECHQGRYQTVTDCQVFGFTCGGTPAACSGDVTSCTSVSCPQLFGPGFQCAQANGQPVCSLGNKCQSGQQDTCDPSGHQAQFCNAGLAATYDCKAAGWTNSCQNGLCANP